MLFRSEILYKTLAAALNGARSRPGQCEAVEGMEWVDKVIGIDQSPIGRTPRSNPATYTSVFGDIRSLFANTQGTKMSGKKCISICKMPPPSQASQRPPLTLKLKRPGP